MHKAFPAKTEVLTHVTDASECLEVVFTLRLHPHEWL